MTDMDDLVPPTLPKIIFGAPRLPFLFLPQNDPFTYILRGSGGRETFNASFRDFGGSEVVHDVKLISHDFRSGKGALL